MKRTAKIVAVVFGLLVALTVVFPFWLMLPMVWSGWYEGMRSDRSFEEAHARAVNTFVEGEGFGIARIRRAGLWNEFSVVFEGRRYQSFGVRLIGLTEEYGPRYFEGQYPPRKGKIADSETRELTREEIDAVVHLVATGSAYEQLGKGDDGLIQVIAPIQADKSCMECHEGDSGSILGAFEYELYLYEENAD